MRMITTLMGKTKCDVHDVQLNDMHEKVDQLIQTVEAFLDTSEVVIGPYLGEPMAGQME